MGNKMSRRRSVPERLTRPQRLLRRPSDVDYKKLKKLILSRKLAPCFDAVDDPDQFVGCDLEECPICFLYYPSLNRSRCCAKGICTECFLQMKPSHDSRPAQCPFCKTSCYAVEYRGARTDREKGLEQEEEQKVIEAKIRMQSKSQIEERMSINQPQTILDVLHSFPNTEGPSVEQSDEEREQIENSTLQVCAERHEEVSVDLEEIMLMEAIWLSLQDSGSQRSESIETNRQNQNLVEHVTLNQEVSETDWETEQTNQNPFQNYIHESNVIQQDMGCSSSSDLTIAKQSCILAVPSS